MKKGTKLGPRQKKAKEPEAVVIEPIPTVPPGVGYELKDAAPKAIEYFWFRGESVDELVRRIQSSGVMPRLEVYVNGNECTFDVKHTDGSPDPEGVGPVADSHRCPSDCPELYA